MSFASYEGLPAWAMLVSLGAHFVAGIAVGVLYFRSLWWSTRRFVSGGRAMTTLALTIGRFVLLGGLLILTSMEGALPLLVTALGVLVARSAIMRRVREAAP